MISKIIKKYKLKEHVTSEMLEAVGFEIENHFRLSHGTRKNELGEVYALVNYEDDEIGLTGTIAWNENKNDHIDITPYIQDLIDLGYVEEVE